MSIEILDGRENFPVKWNKYSQTKIMKMMMRMLQMRRSITIGIVIISVGSVIFAF